MKALLTIILGVTLGASAWSDNRQVESKDKDLGKLIDTCRHLEANSQMKPFSTDVICRGHRTFWQLSHVEPLTLASEFVVRAEVSMKGDRYQLDEFVRAMTSEPSKADCNVYEEIRVDIPAVATKVNSCSELEAIANDGRDIYCANQLSNLPVSLQDGVATGRTFNSCSGSVAQK